MKWGSTPGTSEGYDCGWASKLLVAMGIKGQDNGRGYTVVPLFPLDKLVPVCKWGTGPHKTQDTTQSHSSMDQLPVDLDPNDQRQCRYIKQKMTTQKKLRKKGKHHDSTTQNLVLYTFGLFPPGRLWVLNRGKLPWMNMLLLWYLSAIMGETV